MTSLNISMPDSMRQWVEATMSAEGFSTASEYVRSLIREDQRRRAKQELDAKLLNALDSGPETELTDEDWKSVRSKLREKLLKKGA
jgi:antitoxin ParD1/3/4